MLKLTKKGDKYWLFEDSQIGLFSPSKFTINLELNQIVIVYENGLKSKIYNVIDCEIYDLGELTPFTTSSGDLFMQKLEELNCPCFQKNENIYNIYGGGAWGSITGALADQTDLQGALDDKQDTLESSTNIKTINGNSVLGSGNLVISNSNVVTEINTTGTASSGTAETITYSLLIPANTMIIGVYDAITRVNKTGAAGTVTVKMYANDTNDLTTPILIGTSISTSTARYMPLQKFINIKVLNGTGLGTEVANNASNTSFPNDYIQHGNTVGMSNVAIDWTIDQYLIVTVTNSNAGNSSTGTFLILKK